MSSIKYFEAVIVCPYDTDNTGHYAKIYYNSPSIKNIGCMCSANMISAIHPIQYLKIALDYDEDLFFIIDFQDNVIYAEYKREQIYESDEFDFEESIEQILNILLFQD